MLLYILIGIGILIFLSVIKGLTTIIEGNPLVVKVVTIMRVKEFLILGLSFFSTFDFYLNMNNFVFKSCYFQWEPTIII